MGAYNFLKEDLIFWELSIFWGVSIKIGFFGEDQKNLDQNRIFLGSEEEWLGSEEDWLGSEEDWYIYMFVFSARHT